MAIQKEVNLNEPLDVQAKPTLKQTNLTPDLAEGVLNLHGDYYRQLQAKCNRYIFWNPVSISAWFIGLSIHAYWILSQVIRESPTFADMLKHEHVFTHGLMILPGLIVVTAFVGLIAFLISDDFRSISDKLEIKAYYSALFGFDLVNFAGLPSTQITKSADKQLLKQGENSSVLVYRESPIAVATVVPVPEKSTADEFVVQISGLHVRKVFEKVDFDEVLLDWAIERAQALNTKKAAKVSIYIDAYSFDTKRIKTLKDRFFEKVSSTTILNPFVEIVQAQEAVKGLLDLGIDNSRTFIFGIPSDPIDKFFGVEREIYVLNVSKKTNVEKI